MLTLYIQHILKIQKKINTTTRLPTTSCMYIFNVFVLGLEKNITNDLLLGSVFYNVMPLNTYLIETINYKLFD